MASTATFLPELSETPDAIEQKAQALADLIRTSKHFIAFTGAGVSTSAGRYSRCVNAYSQGFF
jgi:hypothetical protein